MKNSIKFSQNFLKSSSLVKTLLEKTSINSEDKVYEIGPGLGVITSELAAHCKEVIAVEADTRLYQGLQEKLKNISNVKLLNNDFLAQPLSNKPYKVFSNIPFNITADIVRKLIEAKNPPLDSYLFVQMEAAKKFAGQPCGSQETQFSVLTKPWFDIDVIYKFQRTDFKPMPAVDVVLLRIEQLENPLVDEASKESYQDFIVFAFNATKPNLNKGLHRIFTYNQFKRLAKDLGFSIDVKPSELDLRQWIGLFSYYSSGVAKEKKQLILGAYSKLKRQQSGLEKVHRTEIAKDWMESVGK